MWINIYATYSSVPKKVEHLVKFYMYNYCRFNKRKYEEVQEAKRHGKGPYKHMKRLKKRKK
jgi:hypothetical protein